MSDEMRDPRRKLVLASASPRRLALLQQVGIEPDALRPTDVDETPRLAETPRALATRLAEAKLAVGLEWTRGEPGYAGALVVAADTVVAIGRRILPKALTTDDAVACLRHLSGRSHHVWTAVAVNGSLGRVKSRLIDSRVRFKRLTGDEIDAYVEAREWYGKAGGYAIQGLAATFVVQIVGSYTGVVGLPIAETVGLLAGEGYPVRANWTSPLLPPV
jgi:septum formation protein